MKQRGRDVLIGVLLGAALIIWVTTRHHTNNSSSSHPRATVSASHSPAKHAARTPAVQAPASKAAAPATRRPTPAASTHPSALTHSSTRLASNKSADSGIGNGVIAIAALIAIAASLSTVALTVRHMRAGSMRGETR
jgi:hypothetical protein